MLAKCPSRDQLAAYFCGKLPEEPSAEIGEHLGACAMCKNVAASVEKLPDPLADRLRKLKTCKPLPSDPDLPKLLAKVQANAATTVVYPAKEDLAEPPPPRTVGNYQVLERLGKGGMGVVYKAQHVELRWFAAIKFMISKRLSNADDRDRFKREGKFLARLKHPNVAKIYDAGQTDDLPFFIMEFIEGLTLAQLLQESGQAVPVPEACELMYQAAQGLQHAHDAGVIHRDIKPGNLMLDMNGTLKILDMGLARSEDMPSGTSTGHIIGTPDYMAPEQCETSQPVDFRADLYALGCTLYHLLAGRPPFVEKSVLDKLSAHCKKTSEPISHVPKELNAMIQKMLAKNPRERHGSAREVAAGLEIFRRGAVLERLLKAPPSKKEACESSVVRLEGMAQRRDKPRRNQWVLASWGLMGLILVASGIYWMAGPNTPERRESAAGFPDAVEGEQGSPKEIVNMSGSNSEPIDIRFTPDGKMAVSLSSTRTYKAPPLSSWDLGKKSENKSWFISNDLFRGAIALSPDGKTVISGVSYGMFTDFLAWDSTTGKTKNSWRKQEVYVSSLVFSPKGRYLAAPSKDGLIRVYEVAGGQKFREFKHGTYNYAAQFSPDEKYLYTASNEDTVRTWNLELATQETSFEGHEGEVIILGISLDGKRLFSVGKGPAEKLIVWDTSTNKQVHAIQVNRNKANLATCYAFSVDGKRALTGHKDGTLTLWNLATGEKMFNFGKHKKGSVTAVAFAPDGRTALSGGEDLLLRLWQLPYIPGGPLPDPLEKKK